MRRSPRRQFLSAAIAGAATGLAGRSSRSAADPVPADEETGSVARFQDGFGLETVTAGIGAPTAVAFAPDADRRYVAELGGLVYVHESGRLDEPFLDLRDRIEPRDEAGDEQGLLGMALHPGFAENRRVFIRYSAPRRPEMRSEYSHRFLVAEFEATEDGRRLKGDSERPVLEIPQPRPLHNAGDLAFGPDGYLYVPVGDSGRSRYGQDVRETLLGSVLRIDVDERPEDRGYSVPDDNPLVDEDGLDEYYAWGFRNPWRLSFDGETLLVADVGQSSYEEVNVVEKGGNYGWNVKEGTNCFKAEDCPDRTPEDVRGGEPLVDPVVEYPHAQRDPDGEVSGISIIGGHVYRGSAFPELEGTYVFGDFIADGRLFVADPADGSELWSTAAVEITDGAEKLTRLLALGRDDDGEVYVLGSGADGGGLFRVVPAS